MYLGNPNFLKPNKNPILAPSKGAKKPPPGGSDDMVSLMAQRLANVEK